LRAVVLAAGRGERLWPLTENRPKHLLPAGGTPIIESTLQALSQAGIRDVTLVVNFQEDKLRKELGDRRYAGCNITFVRQRATRGTADALNSAKDELAGEDLFLAVYGDNYYDGKAISRMVEKAVKSSEMMIAVASAEDSSRFGRLVLKKGVVQSIREKLGRGRGHVNAGIYLLDRSIFPAAEKTRKSVRNEYELTDTLEALLRKGRTLNAFLLQEGEWVGLSYPWDLLEANRIAMTSCRTSITGRVEAGTRLQGPVVVKSDALVKSGSYIEGPVFVDEGASVGPNSYIRPYTVVGRNVKVGAGCEVKNSVIMANSTVPHLSYVGDSIIGENCSLGAGTITANLRFDESTVKSTIRGVSVNSRMKKLGAVLGDSVRTGVNVSLLPGVKIGSGAWIGPGATVKTDLPARARFKG
jgi:bifunctional UDP-N-acetylglucosamine pyrophosphorylase/glucosamine-1-phosphate N-acetyltransferase